MIVIDGTPTIVTPEPRKKPRKKQCSCVKTHLKKVSRESIERVS